MALKPIPELEILKPLLVSETNKLILSEKGFMDQVLLSTSLLRWGFLPPKITIQNASSLEALVEDDNFFFFIANIASMLPNPLKQTVGDMGVGKFYYHSPGYNNLLLLENLIWQQKRNSK